MYTTILREGLLVSQLQLSNESHNHNEQFSQQDSTCYFFQVRFHLLITIRRYYFTHKYTPIIIAAFKIVVVSDDAIPRVTKFSRT